MIRQPEDYFAQLCEQVDGGERRYGGITDETALRENLAENCLPASLLDEKQPDYDTFLAERRRLMALKIKQWFEVLS